MAGNVVASQMGSSSLPTLDLFDDINPIFDGATFSEVNTF